MKKTLKKNDNTVSKHNKYESNSEKFPLCEKLACIKPGYKCKGDKNDLSTYRPISNLSYL